MKRCLTCLWTVLVLPALSATAAEEIGLSLLRNYVEAWEGGPWHVSEDLARMPRSSLAQPTEDEPSEIRDLNDQGFRAFERGGHDEALFYFGKALEIDPKDKRARFGIGTTLTALDDAKVALQVLMPLGVDHPREYSIFNNIAWLLTTTRDPEVFNPQEAILISRNALVLAPGDHHVWSTLSEAYYTAGDYERAARAAAQALELAQLSGLRGDRRLKTYQDQLDKCQKASIAMSLVE